VEVLRTANDKGKGAQNLTGNDFAQQIIGNNGANVLEGKGGADSFTGGGGKDVFVLSAAALADPAQKDRIIDFGQGDLVDVSQVLAVAAGTNVTGGGFLRVTSGGLVQVDLDGGGDEWASLSSINGGGAVNVRYLSGGVLTTASVSRTADAQAAGTLQSAWDDLPELAAGTRSLHGESWLLF
jgi:Ca2+-binding RTX toxin-like protein